MVVNLHPGFRPWAPGVEIHPSYNRAFLDTGNRLPVLPLPLAAATHVALFHEARPYR